MSEQKKFKRQFDQDRIMNKAFAELGKHELILVLDHLKPDFNIGKLFRSAEVLSIREIFLIGVGYFNTAPCKGSFRKVKATFFEDFDSCYKVLKEMNYSMYAMNPKVQSYLHEIKLPKNSAFILGHEEFGLSFDPALYPDITGVRIPQFGETDSLNVSIAGSLSAYEYLRQNYLLTTPSPQSSV